jgi:hypothetical protein
VKLHINLEKCLTYNIIGKVRFCWYVVSYFVPLLVRSGSIKKRIFSDTLLSSICLYFSLVKPVQILPLLRRIVFIII